MAEGLFEGVSDESCAAAAEETDLSEVASEACLIGENHMAGVCVIVDLCSRWGGSAPVPDGEVGAGAWSLMRGRGEGGGGGGLVAASCERAVGEEGVGVVGGDGGHV